MSILEQIQMSKVLALGGPRDAEILYDDVTGLPRHGLFRTLAEEKIQEVGEENATFSLIAFDLENFKSYNRQYGFAEGDELLRNLSKLLAEDFADHPVMRYVEDRFYVFSTFPDVEDRIRALHAAVHKLKNSQSVHLKVGIYYFEDQSTDLSLAMDMARLACDSIKGKEGITYRIYDEEFEQSFMLERHIVDSIDEALEKGWIEVWYQPVARAQTGDICGLEALTRWRDPKHGLLMPNDFIPVLESHGLIGKLDAFVVDEIGKRYQRTLRQHGVPLTVSINFSRVDFEMCDVTEMLESMTARYKMPRNLLHVEVTESALANDPAYLLEELHRLREAGYQLWMDDFGSGYSTFSILKHFDFDLIKLDMEFLRDFESAPAARTIITSLVDMAKQLGIQTLCEGVETEEQFEFLREVGCEKVQGYLFSKPLPSRELFFELTKKGYSFEKASSRHYFDELGKINLVGQHLMDLGEDSAGEAVSLVNSLSLAIVERRDNTYRYLAANQAYHEHAKGIGFETLDDMQAGMNDRLDRVGMMFRNCFEEVAASHEPASFDHIDFGRRINTVVYYIAGDRKDNADAFLVASVNLSQHSKIDQQDLAETATHYMVDYYDRVDLLAVDGDYATNIFKKATSYIGHIDPNSVQETVKNYVDQNILEEDREAFMELYDLSTLQERAEGTRSGSLVRYFRTRDKENGWVWKLYLLLPMSIGDRKMCLSCSRDVDPAAFGKNPGTLEALSPEMLWHAAFSVPNLRLFWKDKNRRFAGANQAFLDYYGLRSSRDIIGKTDEDMGWHIDPDPFKSHEEAVIDNGEQVINARGTCLVHGEARRIRATKVPVADETGEVQGLLGFFIDENEVADVSEELFLWPEEETGLVGNNIEKVKELFRERGRDKLTGMLNRIAFYQVLEEYVKAYNSKNIDFEVCLLAPAAVNAYEEYGEGFREKVLLTVGRVVSETLGSRGVCARGDGNSFMIVRQLFDSTYQHCGVCDAIDNIAEVGEIPYEMRYVRVRVHYSAAGSLDKMREMLQQRLMERRSSLQAP